MGELSSVDMGKMTLLGVAELNSTQLYGVS